MNNSTSLSESKNYSVSYALNFVGLIAGAAVCATSLATMSPVGFFAGLAAAMYCLDGVR